MRKRPENSWRQANGQGIWRRVWPKDGIERGTKNGREAGMGTWPLGLQLLSFCYDCLRWNDLAFDNSALTPVAIFAESTLYRELSSERTYRVITNT